MITDALSHTELQAVSRLRKVWVPSKVVLEAISAWLNQAKTIEHIDDGLRALRWCKWQRIKCLHEASIQTIFDDRYQECYQSLKIRSLLNEGISNSIFEISDEDLSALPKDVQAMEKFLTNYSPTDQSVEEVHDAGTSYCERHLWGRPFTQGTGIRIHFWPVQDCFKSSQKK